MDKVRTCGLLASLAIFSSAGAAEHRVIAWGAGDGSMSGPPHFGQSLPPPDLVVDAWRSIDAGQLHSVAVRTDGSVVCWGDNRFGQCNLPPLVYPQAAAAGGRHTLVLSFDLSRQTSVITCAGDNNWGQCTPPVQLQGDSFDILSSSSMVLSAGMDHSVALSRRNGLARVTCWGRNDEGQCDVPSTMHDVHAIAAGDYHTAALDGWGTKQLRLWGDDSRGQCSAPAGLPSVQQVVCGAAHTVVLTENWPVQVLAWGDNTWGQTDIPLELSQGLRVPMRLAAGGNHTICLMSNGQVVTWGRSDYGLASPPEITVPIVEIAAGGFHSLAAINSCPADIDGNSMVEAGDIANVLILWGPCPPSSYANGVSACHGDVDANGEVDSADLAILLLNFGPCP
jgi:alpha-tubulin suppressor-like RCC1 family protein